MIPWPFLFCQKPIVRAPVSGGMRQTLTVCDAEPVAGPSLAVKLAVFGTETQSCTGAGTVRVYVKVRVAKGVVFVAVTVPSRPAKVSVTVMVEFTSVVGVVKSTPAVPLAEPFGVRNVVLSQLAVAVFVPVIGLGFVAYAHA